MSAVAPALAFGVGLVETGRYTTNSASRGESTSVTYGCSRRPCVARCQKRQPGCDLSCGSRYTGHELPWRAELGQNCTSGSKHARSPVSASSTHLCIASTCAARVRQSARTPSLAARADGANECRKRLATRDSTAATPDSSRASAAATLEATPATAAVSACETAAALSPRPCAGSGDAAGARARSAAVSPLTFAISRSTAVCSASLCGSSSAGAANTLALPDAAGADTEERPYV